MMYFSKMVGLHLMFFLRMMEQVGPALQMFCWEKRQAIYLTHQSKSMYTSLVMMSISFKLTIEHNNSSNNFIYGYFTNNTI